jgi:hypothetical protein
LVLSWREKNSIPQSIFMLQYYFLNRMNECKDRCDDRGGGNADWRNPTVRESDIY